MKRIACLLLASCGGPTPAVIATAPPHPATSTTPPPPAPPLGARWVLGHASSWRIGRALDVGGGARVLPGDHGERWLVEGSKRTNAPRLFDEDLIAALRTEKGIDFVGARGSVFRVRDAMGDADEVIRNKLRL